MATDVTNTSSTDHTHARSSTAEQRYVICMKWGDKYGAEYVNRLYNMVSRHLTLDFQMICLTDDSSGIDPAVTCHPIPKMDLPAEFMSVVGKNSRLSNLNYMVLKVWLYF